MVRTVKNQQRKKLHQTQKRRARYMRIIKIYQDLRAVSTIWQFDQMIAELMALNVKYITILHEDLQKMYISPWSGDYHRMMIHACEIKIMESTLLK